MTAPIPNYDESLVPEYTLPDPLQMDDGPAGKGCRDMGNSPATHVCSVFLRNKFTKSTASAA